MKKTVFLLAIFLLILNVSFAINPHKTASPELKAEIEEKHIMIFASFAENEEQLYHTLPLAESIRTFAGKFRDAPIWIYAPKSLIDKEQEMVDKFTALNAEIKNSTAPEEALEFYFARKVFAAAKAEAEAQGKTEILVWMDEDTIVIKEPLDFALDQGVSLGYRPVMHQLIGSLYDEPADEFWSQVYEKLSVPESAIFPMITPADQKKIRPYFNAGLLVVRPERGILRKWAECFPLLYQDTVFAETCKQDRLKRIFLHQVALAGAILNLLKQEEMTQLSLQYNFPLFFKQMFGAVREFDSLDDVVTFRYDVYFRNPDPNWSEKLKGPKEVIDWLKVRLEKKILRKNRSPII
jgi:hypothetical protein